MIEWKFDDTEIFSIAVKVFRIIIEFMDSTRTPWKKNYNKKFFNDTQWAGAYFWLDELSQEVW